MNADTLMREFAAKHGITAELRWAGVTHQPWRCTFLEHYDEPIGFGMGKFAALAVQRAIEDTEARLAREKGVE